MPTLVDDGFALWESRAIMVYLVEKYGKTASLYPSDPKARAIVNQRMYFDMGTLYERLAAYYYPQIFAKAPANPENMKKLEEAVGYLNTFLEGQTYAVSFKLLSLLFFFALAEVKRQKINNNFWLFTFCLQAGDNLTVADITLVATVSTLDVASFDLSKYPNVVAWYERCKATAPGYDINEAGLAEFKKFFN